MNKKPVIKKIKFTKEEQEEIDLIKKGQAVPKTKIVRNKNGYSYEYTSNKRFSYEVSRRRLVELYEGGSIFCGQQPDYRVSYDVGDVNQPAKRIEPYWQTCFDKWQDRINWKKKKSQMYKKLDGYQS